MASNSNIRTNDPTKVPALPRIPADTPPSLRRYLELLEQTTNIRLGRRGDPRDRAITLRELIDSGLATELAQKPFDSNRGGDPGFVPPGSKLPDLTVPPAPTGFSATGAFSTIIIAFTFPSYSNHSHTEIWSHTSDSIGDATLVGIQTGRVFTDPVGSGVINRYYWARHVNTDSVVGPFNAAAGTQAQTATDVDHMLGVLSTAIRKSELAQELSDPIDNLPADTQAAITANENAIIDINNVSLGSNSASATAIRAVNSILYDNPAGTGNSVVSALALTRMKTQVLDANGVATATAEEMKFLSSDYTNPETGATDNVTLKQSLNTSASNVNGLRGQYSVKIDTNGHVAGFGFSSTLVGDTPSSAFIVNSDKFAIVSPTDTSSPTNSPNTNNVPFIVQSSTDNDFNGTGETVQAGVYMREAFIRNGSIVTAKIGSLAADKITSGFISADRIDGNSINASKLVLDNSTIESATINGVPTVQIKNLGVSNAKISDLNATKLTAGSLTVYNAADSNTMGKLFSATSGYVATTAYSTNSTTNMSYASAVSDWTGSGPYHYNPSTSLNMPGRLVGNANGTSSQSFTIPDVDGNQTHVEVTIMFGCHPIGVFNGDESSFCTVHLQTTNSLANTGSYSSNSMVFDGTTFVEGSTFASVPLTGVHTVSLNPGTWYVWLFAWSRKADLSSGGSHGFSDGYVHVNSFYK